MEWNVYYYDINKQIITTFNIFRHWGFKTEVQEYLHMYDDKLKFAESVRIALSYYFRSKAEYEVLISPWIGGNLDNGMKVDIYSQIILNWDKFIDYIWSGKNV